MVIYILLVWMSAAIFRSPFFWSHTTTFSQNNGSQKLWMHKYLYTEYILTYTRRNERETGLIRHMRRSNLKTSHSGFALKTHETFSVTTIPEEFKNTTITGYFGFAFEKNSVREITWLLWRQSLSKCSVFKINFVHTKTQSPRFRISLVWRAFSKSSVFVTG